MTQSLLGAALLGYGSYLPAWRIDPSGKGHSHRIVASFDEDSTTMAVEAAREVLRTAGPAASVTGVVLVTSSPAYLDKTNATAVHAGLGLDRRLPASDAIGTARSTIAALRSAFAAGGLVVAADVRVGRPGSSDEANGADGAAAVLVGEPGDTTPAIAELLADVPLTDEFLDRWRVPTQVTGEQWEERFGFERYAALVRDVAERALDAAGLAEADHVVLTSPNTGVRKRAGSLVKGRLTAGGSPVGFAGAADPLLGLAAVLDQAAADETVLLISAADGADAIVLRTTGALPARRQAAAVAEQASGGRIAPYPAYLSWRGLLEVELPRRPEPDRPAAPPTARGAEWKFGLHGSRCDACGFVHLPPMRVCRQCGAAERMQPVPVASLEGRVATFTVDRLAYSPSPPVVDVVVDFAGGGRTTFEVADAEPDRLSVGAPVDMAFRRLFTAGGVHNYFWKAKQLRAATADDEEDER